MFRLSMIVGFVVLVSGCSFSGQTSSFDWVLSESPVRGDISPSGISEDRQQSSVQYVDVTVELPDGVVYDIQAGRMWVNFDSPANTTGDPSNDRLEALNFHVLMGEEEVLVELKKLADSIGYDLDVEYVQNWVDTHDKDKDPRLGIRVSGWPSDDNPNLALGVKDRGSGRYRVSLTIWWVTPEDRELLGSEQQPTYE